MADKLSAEILQPVRGSRDFFGEEKNRRDYVVELLKEKFKSFGFEPLETPSMERLEVLSSKFAGGEEILKETFKVTNQGGRELGLRYDLTVPLCRYIASNTRIPMPFKRFAIGPVWRDGPLKTGRFREFVQCDVDTVGAASFLADAELLALASEIMEKLFGKNFIIKINNRKILDGILEFSGVDEGIRKKAILELDKLAKIGPNGVKQGLETIGIDSAKIKVVMDLANADATESKTFSKLEKNLTRGVGLEGILEIRQVLGFAGEMNCKNLEFDPSLARGLNYYTSTIFEVYLKDSEIKSSLAAGGRYDDLIGKFAGVPEKIPAVGISFGLDVICECLRDKKTGLWAKRKSAIVFLAIKDDQKVLKYALEIAAKLRGSGKINCLFDLNGRSVSKNLEFASKKGIEFAIIVGIREFEEMKVTIKELATGKESTLAIEDALRKFE
ncbi:histidine--tRNA ligase [Candidatus Micrarchaeota archaeon]|nr:histidine--tRNA ligase [Candidatus Micrarchaeota archaeon]